MDQPSIDLFWTGGWDSTFRLLCLVLVERISVKPYYVIDTDRRSVLFELRARERIKQELLFRHPWARDLLMPGMLVLKTDIEPNAEITRSYRALTATVRAGEQYEWLARWAAQLGVYEIETCIPATLPGHESELLSTIVSAIEGKGHNCRIGETVSDAKLELFKYFRFPLIFQTKGDMARQAEQHGFIDMLALTWFCHNPTRDGLACGECIPCMQRRESDLPAKFARKGVMRRVFWKLNALARK